MEIVNLKEVKEYCENHEVSRDKWVADVACKLSTGESVIQYRDEDNYLVTIDMFYIHSQMKSLDGFDEAFHAFMDFQGKNLLGDLEYKQLHKTIGELAERENIGIV